jgi:hypothetical protein
LLFGHITFLLLYYAVPYWFDTGQVAQTQSSVNKGLEAIAVRGARIFHYLGVICGLIGLFFGIRNYFVLGTAECHERGGMSLFARLLGRNLIEELTSRVDY